MMTPRVDDNRFLNRVFLIWLALAGSLSLVWPETRLDTLLGHRAVWTLLMPGACLMVLNPRRAVAALLALAWWPLVVVRRLLRMRDATGCRVRAV